MDIATRYQEINEIETDQYQEEVAWIGRFFGTLAAYDFPQLGELSFMQYYMQAYRPIKCLDLLKHRAMSHKNFYIKITE